MLAVAFAVTGILAFGHDQAQAKFKQPGCAKFNKKIKKAKGKTAKKRLKLKSKQCKANRKVYNQVKNSRFVGARSDGEPVDLIFCANGKLADDYRVPVRTDLPEGLAHHRREDPGQELHRRLRGLISASRKIGNTGRFRSAPALGFSRKEERQVAVR